MSHATGMVGSGVGGEGDVGERRMQRGQGRQIPGDFKCEGARGVCLFPTTRRERMGGGGHVSAYRRAPNNQAVLFPSPAFNVSGLALLSPVPAGSISSPCTLCHHPSQPQRLQPIACPPLLPPPPASVFCSQASPHARRVWPC